MQFTIDKFNYVNGLALHIALLIMFLSIGD